MAILTAAGAFGSIPATISPAEAALYYWSDSDPGFSRPEPVISHRRQKPRHHQRQKIEAPAKEAAKPQGPLIIAISIEKQKLKIYDANGFFAETPISTGMKGHPTPMGVFSVIQKHKLHHSNIYSGAPMPFMQRITWSGVAMHAGVLPGYPASHGCIRMPMAFAVKMWGWTRMGARVVVTPGEMTPAKFSHPLLVAQKSQPIAAEEPKPDTPPTAKSDKASDAGATGQPETSKPVTTQASLELRSSIGHDDRARPVVAEAPVAIALRERTQTADASTARPATSAAVTMTDATSSGGPPSPRVDTSAPAGDTAAIPADAMKSETVDAKAEPSLAKSSEAASTDDKPPEAKAAEAAAAEAKPAGTDKTEAAASEAVKAEQRSGQAKAGTKADDVKMEAAKTDAPDSNQKANEAPNGTPDQGLKAATNGPSIPEVDTRRPDSEKATAAPAIAAAPRRSGQIAVFVSRKDSKLYVRQNFAPLFDVPVAIAPSDRPLGTHVFTAQADRNDANILHWSVFSLPVRARYAERRDEDERASRRHKMAGAVETKPMPVPDNPAEALDRISIPPGAMARIAEALSTGSSIIVSDQGITAGETGEGTDFIVSLR